MEKILSGFIKINFSGILLSLNSQCKMDTEDLCILDDPNSKKKYMFLSKFVSIVQGDHDFALRLALNVMANAVQASRTNQDDTSKEMLSFIKSQLEFMRVQYKSAQAAEREAAKTVMSLQDNINKVTRQVTEWETPVTEFFDKSEFTESINSGNIASSAAGKDQNNVPPSTSKKKKSKK